MNIKDVALNVGVSPDELIEILNDINISVDGIDAELDSDQIEKVCDELGYSSFEEAKKDNPNDEESQSFDKNDDIDNKSNKESIDKESIDEDVKTEKIIELKKPKFLLKNLQIF